MTEAPFDKSTVDDDEQTAAQAASDPEVNEDTLIHQTIRPNTETNLDEDTPS